MKKVFFIGILSLYSAGIAVAQKKPQPKPHPKPKISYSNAKQVKKASDEAIIPGKGDILPKFPGGQDSMIAFVNRNMHYPKDALDSNKQGAVKMRFVVNKEGKITHIRLLNTVTPSIDREAVRILRILPNWNPGIHNGKKTSMWIEMPLEFILE